MQIGKKIKNLRLKKGLTQEELGELPISKGYISQLERDLSSPSIETFFTILEVLGMHPKDFFDEEERIQKVVYGEEDTNLFSMKNADIKFNGLFQNQMKGNGTDSFDP